MVVVGSLSGHPSAAGAERETWRGVKESRGQGGSLHHHNHHPSSSQFRLCLPKQSTGSGNGHLSCKAALQSHIFKKKMVVFVCESIYWSSLNDGDIK